MPSILGHIIVIAVLAVIVFLCMRNIIRDLSHELSGGGCGGCGGTCSGGCASCSKGSCAHNAKAGDGAVGGRKSDV